LHGFARVVRLADFRFPEAKRALQPVHLNVRLAGDSVRQTLFKRDLAFSCIFLRCGIK
jgi:hypothetical protein